MAKDDLDIWHCSRLVAELTSSKGPSQWTEKAALIIAHFE